MRVRGRYICTLVIHDHAFLPALSVIHPPIPVTGTLPYPILTMKLFTLVSGALLLASSTALPHWPGHHGPPPGYGGKKAVYFLRVDPAGSNVVAIELASNGKLTDSTTVTSTNGNGLQSQNASSPDLAPTAIDPLQGQTSISVGDNVRRLYKNIQ